MDRPASQPWPARGPILGPLPDFLFRADGDKVVYILKAWLLAIVPSLLLAATIQALSPKTAGPDLSADTPLLVALLVVIGPLLETLIMAGILIPLAKWLGATRAVIVSAAGWAVAHSLAEPVWGLVVWWPFLVLSIVFLTWRQRGLWLAIGMATAVHGLQNSVPAAALFFAGNG